jgi:hypothetical protein
MLTRRQLWQIATPIVAAAHRFGWCGYEYVNRCKAANNRSKFWPTDHYEWFGDPIAEMPDEAVVCGIGYDVQCAEGLVTFVNTFGPLVSRITFTRDPHDPLADLWYVSVSGNVPASHVIGAYRWVGGVFGGSFEKRNTDAARAATTEEG